MPSTDPARGWRRCFRPASSLMGRLRYAQKFLLIGVVLVVPLVYVVYSFLHVQQRDISFANKEQVGLVYVKPATELLTSVVNARAVAVQVATGNAMENELAVAQGRVRRAIAGVDAAHGAGTALGLTQQWLKLKRQIQTVLATPVHNAGAALASYDQLTSQLEALIAQDGNNSYMILDPDDDSYYLMDAMLNRLPVLLDDAGQVGDLQTVLGVRSTITFNDRIRLEDMKSSIQSTLANADPDYASALENTHYTAMKAALSPPLERFDSAIGAVISQLGNAVRASDDVNGVDAYERAAVVASTATALNAATLPVTEHLLNARIAGFDRSSTITEIVAVVCVLLAIYIFVGFYLSVRNSQAAILDGLQALQDSCTDPLCEGLDAMADGDLTREIDPQVPEIPQTTRDELGLVAAAANTIRERVIGSSESFNATSRQLREQLGDRSCLQQLSTGMQSMSADCGAGLARCLRAMADDDLTAVAETHTEPIAQRPGFELGSLAETFNETLASSQSSIHAYNVLRERFADRLGDHCCLDALDAGMRTLSERCLAPLQDGLQTMNHGDLTRSVEVSGTPIVAAAGEQIGSLAQTLNAMLDTSAAAVTAYNETRTQLTQMIRSIARNSESLTAASTQLASTSDETDRAIGEIADAVSSVAAGADRQVESAQAALVTTDAVAVASQDSADAAERVATAAADTSSFARDGVETAQSAAVAIRQVRDSADEIAAVMSTLSVKSEQIGGILATITGIAEQTNLLALNAAIEAARAGEHGAGFAVVADEVRKLAEESRHAAESIGSLIGEMQTATTTAVRLANDSTQQTNDGVAIVEQARDKFVTIGEQTEQVSERISAIAEAVRAIAASGESLRESMNAVTDVAAQSSAATEEVSASTEQSSASTQQVAASAQQLAGTAGELDELIGAFTLV